MENEFTKLHGNSLLATFFTDCFNDDIFHFQLDEHDSGIYGFGTAINKHEALLKAYSEYIERTCLYRKLYTTNNIISSNGALLTIIWLLSRLLLATIVVLVNLEQ